MREDGGHPSYPRAVPAATDFSPLLKTGRRRAYGVYLMHCNAIINKTGSLDPPAFVMIGSVATMLIHFVTVTVTLIE